MSSRLPNLFIVGAPKSGTTAMASYLGTHPDICVGRKELHYFGSDVQFRHWQRIGREEYLGYFRNASDDTRYLCDASVWYLFSKTAAEEIQAASPDARILIMLRNPVDLMYSLHSQALFSCEEVLSDFRAALAAEPNRTAGIGIPEKANVVETLLYRQAARFKGQVGRYLDVFGRDRVQVMVFEEFAADPRASYASTLHFLDLPDDGRQEFPVVNPNHKLRHASLAQFLHRPPALVGSVGRALVPSRRARRLLGERFARWNRADVARPTLDPDLRRELEAEFAPEVVRVEELLGRPLPWFRDVRCEVASGPQPTADGQPLPGD